MTNQILLATHNKGKIAEFQQLFQNSSFTLIDQNAFSLEPAVESGLSFVENALIKARHASFLTGLPTIADDSGLVVDKLNGQPGIYSARYAGDNSTDQKNRIKLLKELEGTPRNQRQAAFFCVLVFLRHWQDPVPLIAQASWQGEIAEQEHGHNGFGYDSLFYIEAYQKTSAQLTPDEKNSLSHRGKAMRQLLQQFEQYP